MTDLLNDPARLRALHEAKLLDQPVEPQFNVFTRLVSRTLNVPVSTISLIDADRQFFASFNYLPEPLATCRETPLSHSFCKHVVALGEALVISDARVHPLVKDNPAIQEQGVVAYVGVPLITHEGFRLGSLCAVDTEPREWSAADIATITDLAAAAMTEIEWRRRANSAEMGIASRDHFIAILSHELRTPLAPALLSASALALDARIPPDARADASAIQRNIEIQSRLIDTIQDFSHIATGELKIERHAVDVHTIINEASAFCSDDARKKDIRVSFDLRARRHQVMGDPIRIRQLVTNLLDNAIKFSPARVPVVLRTSDDADGTLRIDVTDTGVGIPSHLLPLVFSPFEQSTSAASVRFGGLGLGLYIAKGVVDLHSGRISVTSNGSSNGATFTVNLLALVTEESVSATPPAASNAPTYRSILLVDDHEDTLRLMRRFLERLGHRVMTANSVSSAIQLAESHPFSLLISDIGLRDGTGIDLLNALRASLPPIPSIAVSGYGMDTDVQKALEAGFTKHLTKPLNFSELESTLRLLPAMA